MRSQTPMRKKQPMKRFRTREAERRWSGSAYPSNGEQRKGHKTTLLNLTKGNEPFTCPASTRAQKSELLSGTHRKPQDDASSGHALTAPSWKGNGNRQTLTLAGGAKKADKQENIFLRNAGNGKGKSTPCGKRWEGFPRERGSENEKGDGANPPKSRKGLGYEVREARGGRAM